jgi:membrane protease YdiL (CAAX protease family)
MKTLSYLAIALAVIFVMLTVYFLIPGIYHPYLAFHDGTPGLVNATKHWGTVSSVHRIYAVGAFIVALACGLIAFFTRPKKQVVRVA